MVLISGLGPLSLSHFNPAVAAVMWDCIAEQGDGLIAAREPLRHHASVGIPTKKSSLGAHNLSALSKSSLCFAR